ncbi:unnamed protein product [Orchesella dallaii]|uniref:Uncharacterized protein n=1 Tax=Orchesella dallaii TaxID=48710 RepID=A0ABP1PN30_9HEXA
MCNHNLQFGMEQLNYIKEIEVFIFLIGAGSIILPPSYLPFFLTENEPMHEFFQDVFEVDVSLKLNYLPVFLVTTWVIYSCGGIAFHIMSVGIIYFEFTVVCISSLIPQNLVPHRGQENFRMPEYHVQTTCFGILHETEVLQIYRTLQVFNILSNNIYATILLSAHHPLLMLTMVGLSFLLIRFFEIVYAAGLIAIIVVFTDEMCNHNLQFGLEQLNFIKEIEVFVFLISVGSIILPPWYLPFFLTENEPMHEFFQDVFEVDVSLKVNYLPILLLITWVIYSCGGIAFHIMSVVIIYFEFTVVCISSLMPQSLVPHRGQENFRMPEYHVQTTSFGILHETEVLQMYRTLQVFNILSNNIFATILLSAHHPLLMLILVGLSFILIRFFEFVYAAGLMAMIMVFRSTMERRILHTYSKLGIVFDYDSDKEANNSKSLVSLDENFVKRKSAFGKIIHIKLHNKLFFTRVANSATMGLGETYMDGHLGL